MVHCRIDARIERDHRMIRHIRLAATFAAFFVAAGAVAATIVTSAGTPGMFSAELLSPGDWIQIAIMLATVVAVGVRLQERQTASDEKSQGRHDDTEERIENIHKWIETHTAWSQQKAEALTEYADKKFLSREVIAIMMEKQAERQTAHMEHISSQFNEIQRRLSKIESHWLELRDHV